MLGDYILASVNPQIVAANLNDVRLHSNRLIHNQLTVRHVILPAVPGAGHGHAMELALTERAATVQAGVIDRVEFITHVSNGNRQAIYLKFAKCPRRDFILSRGVQPQSFPPHIPVIRRNHLDVVISEVCYRIREEKIGISPSELCSKPDESRMKLAS